MKKIHLGTLAFALSALTASAGAFASGLGASASAPGPGAGNSGRGCTQYVYHILKVGPDHARPNEDFTYKIIVRNIGDCDLRRIRVSDFLPERTRFVFAHPAPSETHDRKLEWKDVRIEVGERAEFEVTVRAEDIDHHQQFSVTNTGCAFTPLIGTRICDTATTWIREDEHPVQNSSVLE